MPRTSSKTKKTKARSHDSGLWLVTGTNDWIEVVQKAITSDKIIPPIKTVKGRPRGKSVELLSKAKFVVFREDSPSYVASELEKLKFTAEKVFPGDPIAPTKFLNFITVVLKIVSGAPMLRHEEAVVDSKLRKVDEWEEYIVKEDEEGKVSYEVLPYIQQTHSMPVTTVIPRLFYHLWYPDKLYELPSYNPADVWRLKELGDKLDNYPFPVKVEGEPVLDENDEPTMEYGEGMIWVRNFCAQSGSKRLYHAFIIPKNLKEKNDDGEIRETFVFEMKLSRSLIQYATAQEVVKLLTAAPSTITGALDRGDIEKMLAEITI